MANEEKFSIFSRFLEIMTNEENSQYFKDFGIFGIFFKWVHESESNCIVSGKGGNLCKNIFLCKSNSSKFGGKASIYLNSLWYKFTW